jgi:hypothetical protein
MFDKTDFAAALLVLSAVVLPGCGGGDSENFQAGATVPVVAGGTPEVPAVAGGTPETPATTGVTPEVPAAPGDTPVARVIKHPGVGVTLSDLATLKAYVDQGREPWTSGFEQVAGSPMSRLSYGGHGPFAKVSRAPDENLWAWRNDMVAISNLSLMWYFTRDERYAENARKFLLGWATTQTEFSGRESMLDLGDYAL